MSTATTIDGLPSPDGSGPSGGLTKPPEQQIVSGQGKRTAKNVVSTVITQTISWALTLAVIYFLPRYAGSDGLGEMAFASRYIGLFIVIAPLGTGMVLVREVARDPKRSTELLLATMLLRFPLGFLALALAYGSSFLFGFDALTRTLIAIGGVNAIIGSVGEVLVLTLQGQERMVRSNMAGLIQRFAESVMIIALVLMKAPLWTIVATGGVSATLLALIALSSFDGLGVEIRQFLGSKDRRRIFDTARVLFFAGMPFLGWTVAKQMYGYTDPLVLGFVSNKASIGYYDLAFRLIGTSLFIPVAITSALFPTMARYYREDPERYQSLARQMFSLIVLIAMPVGVLLLLGSGQVLPMLPYKADLVRGTLPVLQVGAFASVTYFLGIALGSTIVAADRQKAMFRSSVIGVLIGIPLCFAGSFLTKHYLGNAAIGAMASDAVMELLLIVMYASNLPYRLFDRAMLVWLLRAAAAAVTMGIGLYISAIAHFGIGGVLGSILLYAVACIVFGSFDRQWIIMARGMLLKR